MCACATPRLILQLGSKERQPQFGSAASNDKNQRIINAVRGNDASQSVSIPKPSMVLSDESLETGTGSSNSLRSTIQSFSFSDISENRSKSTRVRAICDCAWTQRTSLAALFAGIEAKIIRSRFC